MDEINEGRVYPQQRWGTVAPPGQTCLITAAVRNTLVIATKRRRFLLPSSYLPTEDELLIKMGRKNLRSLLARDLREGAVTV